MDINWQIAMTAIKIKKFYKKTGRRPRVDGKMHVAFDKRKVECFNCHNTGHFARECKFKGSKEGNRQETGKGQNFKPVQIEKEALMTIDEEEGKGSALKEQKACGHVDVRMLHQPGLYTNRDHPLKHMEHRDFKETVQSGDLLLLEEVKIVSVEKSVLLVSSDFKMPDENQVLLKVPRQHNMYTFDMKNVVSSKAYTCLLAKASSDEAKLWTGVRSDNGIEFKNRVMLEFCGEKEPGCSCLKKTIAPNTLRPLVHETEPTSTNPVNTGSDNLNTVFEEVTPGNIEANSPSADHEEEVFSDADDDEMPEIRIYYEVDVTTNPTLRIHNVYPQSQILRDPNTPVQRLEALSKKITEAHALGRLLPVQASQVWVLVDLPNGAKVIGKEDGLTMMSFAPVARIEAIVVFGPLHHYGIHSLSDGCLPTSTWCEVFEALMLQKISKEFHG
ncbi:ribonuclease H-like domain-containing protein [Tanacetum coccineum]|uniref:Ribonuclease H-like domain-containing protein n=1 Tax=Tanacetum coccineum TaxID=301880 RepID=A0ABQ5HMQ5_9ASTR